jgi:hypothetical protein
MSALNQSLLTLVEILLIVTLPIVALAALQNLRLNAARLKAETGESERKTITEVVKSAVAAAEQTGVLQDFVSAEKKEFALEMAEGFLREQGVGVDLKQLSNLIEAGVHDLSRGESPPSSATSSEQQALVNNAVETAVLAAEQSGLKGFIPNVGTDKKNYALNLAVQFLGANGVQIDEEVLSGLVEGQLMKLMLAARGQLPPSG